MNLKIFYHAVNLPGYDLIIRDRLRKLNDSGLLDNAELYLCMEKDSKYVLEDLNPNIKLIHFDGTAEECEHPTIIFMKQMCSNSEEPFYALYLHQKGITARNDILNIRMTHWRMLMDYWCIENWKHCVKKLIEGYNMVGCNFSENPINHFSGNQYWATSEFISTWPTLQYPSSVGFKPQIESPFESYRYDVEFLYGRCPDLKPYSMYNSNIDHYKQDYPESLYRNTIL